MDKKAINIIIAVVVVLAVGGLVFLKNNSGNSETPANPADASEKGDSGTPSDGKPPTTNAKLPKMIDFGREQCLPCKAMMPILEALKKKYKDKATIEFVSTVKHRDVAFEHNVRRIPTQIFFDADGNEVWRHEGFFSREKIEEQFRKMGVK